MLGPARDARIYLLEGDERQVAPAGPAVISPDGTRQEIPLVVYRAVQHVLEAMRAGQAVKVTPLRTELPVDEAAHAIGMRGVDFRKNVAAGEIPFRSSESVDWVQLADVIRWDNERRARRRAALDEMLAEEPWDEQG